MVKKTIALDQDYIDKVRRIFRVNTDKEAVNKMLELAVTDAEIIDAHNRIGGKGKLIDEVSE